METGFLNFHDEEHFSDFSLSLDHQHNLLGESQSSLTNIVGSDYDYVQRLGLDSNDALWEAEQEINGDLAVLPVSGVSRVIPKMENTKEDFAKVLTDWQEHIGYLQATEIEEDIDMVNLDMDLNINTNVDEITPEISSKPKANILSSPVKGKKVAKVRSDSSVKAKTRYARHRISESDQSEKEIDVVGLDSFEEVNSDFDFMHVQRHAATTSKEYNCKILGNTIIKIKQEAVNFKEDSIEYEDEALQADLSLQKTEYTRCTKKKPIKKHKEVVMNKKRRRSVKDTFEPVAKVPKKSKKQTKIEKFVEETSNSNNADLSAKKTPVLEAGDVKSLLEQFEATEAAAQLSALSLPETMEIPTKKTRTKLSVNKSQVTLLKKSVDSQDSKLHKDIRDSLPKEVIDRIKASGRKKTISVIPAIPHTKTGSRNNSTKMQEAPSTLSRNKLLKLVTNNTNNSNGRADGSVQLDHDYCSNSNSAMSSSSSISSCDSNSEYDRRMSDSEPQTPMKEVSCKNQTDSLDKGPFEQTKTGHKLTTAGARKMNWSDSNSKKDSGLESGDVSDASEEQQQHQQQHQPSSSVTKSPIQEASTNTGNPKSLLAKKTTQPKPVYEMKIQSALATSILQLRSGVLTKTKSLESGIKPKQQMVSVLKKPPMATSPHKVLGTNLKESIVTTTNSSNDQVQNIIVQETTDVELPEETEKKPPRRKLNLAEYRSRREQNRSDGSRTTSPVQPMVLIYVHHVSTNTEPINGDPDSPMWSEREIVSVLKPKAEVEEEKVRPKPATRDRGMQTMETVFGVVYEEQEEEEEEAIQSVQDESQSVAQTQTQTELPEEMEKESSVEEGVEEGEVEEDGAEAEGQNPDVIASASINKGAVSAADDSQDAVEEGEVPESGEIVNDDVAIIEDTNKAVACNTVSEKEVDPANKVADGKEKTHNTSINRVRDRRHRNYRRARSSSSSSRSRSRSRSRGRTSRRSRSRSRSRGRSRTRSRSSRSRGKARGDERSGRSSRSGSPSTVSSRSRSRSRSRRQCNPRRRRRISHRRSSVSSTSSWYSRSRSRSRYRSSSSRSRSRSSRSRSRSSRYSSCSRFSSRSNFGCSKWSSRRRKEKLHRRRSYNRRRRQSSGSSHGYNDWRRSPLPYRRSCDEWYVKEKQRQVEERRVIYVGRLKEGITKAELRRRFEVFGPVVDISIHFRERGHNYGFVTFTYKNDAYEAVEHGNDDPSLPRYDLCFGGRRAFCKVKYADLDGAATNVNGRGIYKPEEENTFDLLLKEAQAKLRKRKV